MAASLRDTLSKQVATFTMVKPAPGRWKFALRITISCAVALAVVAVVIGPRAALLGINGATMSVTAGARPWRARVIILGIMDLAFAIACFIAANVGGDPVLLTIFFTVLAGITGLAYHAFLAEPPGPIFLIIGPAIASYMPTVGMPKGEVIAVSALSAVVGSVVNILIDSHSGRHPERDAIDEAATRVAQLEHDVSADEDSRSVARLRDQAYASVFAASLVLDEASFTRSRGPDWSALNARLRQLHRKVVRHIVSAEFPGAPLAVSSLEQRRYLGSPGAIYLLRWALSPKSFPWFAARRLSLAMLLSCITAYAVHIDHPYWAVMTTALVMSLGTDRLSLTHRALHRMAGTLAGLVLFVVLHVMDFHGIDLAVVTLVLVFCIQMTAPRNYAICVIFVTPMALLVATSARPVDLGHVLSDRVLDTAIGVGASLLVMWLTGYRTPVALVRRQYRRTLRAIERVVVLIGNGQQATEAGFVARRDLAYEELQTARILSIAQQELPLRLAGWGQIEALVNRLSYTVLTACWLARPTDHLDAARMASALQQLFASLPPVSTATIDLPKLGEDLRAVRTAGDVPGQPPPQESRPTGRD